MQLRPQLSPSYEELLAKVKILEDERDSLLIALRLLIEDFNETVNDHRTSNTQQVDSAMEWQEVTRGRNQNRNLFNKITTAMTTEAIETAIEIDKRTAMVMPRCKIKRKF